MKTTALNSANPLRAEKGSPPEPPLLAGLIETELIAWAAQLRTTLSTLTDGPPGNAATADVIAQASRQAGELIEKMNTLATIAATYTHAAAGNREHIVIQELAQAVGDDIGGGRVSRIVVRAPDATVAPVYGSRKLLETLFDHLLKELDAGTPPGQTIVLKIHQLGHHLLVTSNIENRLPMHSQAMSGMSSLPTQGLTFALCRRIAEFHGGTLRLETQQDTVMAPNKERPVLHRFTLSLPTGSPIDEIIDSRCEACPFVGQVELYAADLAELLDRCHRMENQGKISHG
jgi:hypothetical protein